MTVRLADFSACRSGRQTVQRMGKRISRTIEIGNLPLSILPPYEPSLGDDQEGSYSLAFSGKSAADVSAAENISDHVVIPTALGVYLSLVRVRIYRSDNRYAFFTTLSRSAAVKSDWKRSALTSSFF